MRRSTASRRWFAGCFVAGFLGVAVPASATFTSTDTEANTFATDTLAAVTSPLAAPGTCVPTVSDAIALSWTLSVSTWLDDHEVLRSTTSGGPYTSIATVGPLVAAYVDTGLAFDTTYHYVVRATKEQWSADSTEVSLTTRSSTCL